MMNSRVLKNGPNCSGKTEHSKSNYIDISAINYQIPGYLIDSDRMFKLLTKKGYSMRHERPRCFFGLAYTGIR